MSVLSYMMSVNFCPQKLLASDCFDFDWQSTSVGDKNMTIAEIDH